MNAKQPTPQAAGRPQAGPQRPETRSFKGWLESIGAVIGITTVLLPVEGAMTRWVSFAEAERFNRFPAPSPTIAVNTSVPDLAATGWSSVVPPAEGFIIGILIGVIVAWGRKPDSGLGKMRLFLIASLLLGAPFAFSAFTMPRRDWFVAAVGFEGGLLGYWWLRDKHVAIVDITILAAIVAVLFAIISGLYGNPSDVKPVSVRFEAGGASNLPDGRYVILGRADGITYLQSCQNLSIHALPDAQLADAQYLKSAPSLEEPLLWDMLRRWKGPITGYRPDC